jgi:hypothetical protein
MPSRALIFAIVLGWLGTVGWLFWRDLWPYWQPGQPPPYDIDIVDEVQNEHQPTFWDVRCNGPDGPSPKDQYQAQTHVEYRPTSDLFVMRCELQVKAGLEEHLRPQGVVRPYPKGSSGANNYIFSSYSITRAGRLRAFSVQVTGEIEWEGPPQTPPLDTAFAACYLPSFDQKKLDFILDLRGKVLQDQLRGHALLSSSQTQIEGALPAQPVEYFGAILMPLHPLHRITGLRPGRRWSLPMIHPFREALRAVGALPPQPPELVQAQVRTVTKELPWGEKKKEDRTCLIVDYQGQDVRGSTWVEQDSGRVLMQEMTLWGQTWTFLRRPAVGIRSSYSTKP